MLALPGWRQPCWHGIFMTMPPLQKAARPRVAVVVMAYIYVSLVLFHHAPMSQTRPSGLTSHESCEVVPFSALASIVDCLPNHFSALRVALLSLVVRSGRNDASRRRLIQNNSKGLPLISFLFLFLMFKMGEYSAPTLPPPLLWLWRYRCLC